jgi:lysophospholipase L1-like esterase
VRYLALGDSYTIGEGVEPEDQWPRHLVRLLRSRGIDAQDPLIIARTAWATDELHDAIDAAPPSGEFDLVSLMVGVNDQYRARTVDHFQTEFDRVLRRAITFAPDPARTIVISIPDWGAAPFAADRDRAVISRDVDAFNAGAKSLVTAAGARWVDVTPASRRMSDDAFLAVADGLHPSGAMYAAWAELVLPVALGALKPG